MPGLVNPFMSFGAGGGGTPGAGAHAYWRINVTDNNGDATFVGVGTLEMYSSKGRLNRCVGGTPIASAAGQFGNILGNAFDDDVNSQWADAKAGAWIGYQFSTAQDIVGVHMRDKGGGQNTLMPRDFQVQCSDDGTTWATRYSVSGADFVTPGNFNGKWFWDPSYAPAYSGSPIAPARYWRVRCFLHTADTFSCAELSLATAPAGATVTTGGTAIANNQTFGAASNAFDANTTTFWAPSNAVGQYLGYDFGAVTPRAIAEMKWRSRSAGVPGQNPVRGVVCFSSDNVNWSSAWEMYDGVTWTDGMQKTFTDPLYV